MDDYVKIQTVFSNFYFKKLKDKMAEFEKKRLLKFLFMFLPFIFALPVLTIVFGSHLYFVVIKQKLYLYLIILVPFFLVFLTGALGDVFKGKTEIDEEIKSLIFPAINEYLTPLLYIEWSKGNFSDKYFEKMVNEHEILKINCNLFSSDDTFHIRFRDVNIEIYEVENKNNAYTIQYISLGIVWFVWALMIGLPVCALLMFVIFRFIPISEELQWTWAYILAVSILYYMVMGKVINVNVNKGMLDKFKGLVINFDMKKNISGHTIIIENNEENLFLKVLKPYNYEKVELEDVEFNNKFSVYTTNQIEARYVLTTSMMNRLLNLKQCFNSKYIRASFKGNQLVLAIQADKDLFRIASNWKKSEAVDYQTMFLELISILKITDALNLQSDTGL